MKAFISSFSACRSSHDFKSMVFDNVSAEKFVTALFVPGPPEKYDIGCDFGIAHGIQVVKDSELFDGVDVYGEVPFVEIAVKETSHRRGQEAHEMKVSQERPVSANWAIDSLIDCLSARSQ